MTPEELHRKVYDELGDGTGRASYDAAFLRVIAPYLHTHAVHQVMNPKQESDCLVDKALKDGRLRPAQERWARSYCGRDRRGFQYYLDCII